MLFLSPLENGKLTLSSKTSLSKGKALIYIPVKQLKHLNVKANAEVASIGLLNSENLEVFIASDCHLRHFAKGKIKVDSDEDHGYHYDYNGNIIQ